MENKAKEAFNNARNLKSHENGVLQPIYQLFTGVTYSGVIYSDQFDPASIYACLMIKPKNNGKYWVAKKIERRDNGDLKKRRECENMLMYRKKYARKPIEVKAVTFDIVGLKRESTNLPAGVLIANVKFEN